MPFSLCTSHGDRFNLLMHVYICFSFGQESYRLFITNEVLNIVSAEMAVSSGIFHAFQCVAMKTAFLAQGVNQLPFSISATLIVA